jgi:D-alanine-D-alanine ligase
MTCPTTSREAGLQGVCVNQPAVIFGGPSPEHDVSILTGLQAARALAKAGMAVEAIYWSKSADFFRVDAGAEAADFQEGVPKGARELRLAAGPGGGFMTGKAAILGKEKPLDISAVVNCCHGGPGEDGTLQGALDLAGVRYTGPTLAGAALGMDKLAFGATVAAAGLPSLPRLAVSADHQAPEGLGPYIVKPRFGGSSIGIEVVEDWAAAVALSTSNVHLRQGAVAEPYRPSAFDVNVAIRAHPRHQLSPLERPLRSSESAEILDYRDKYVGGEGMVSAPRELPARLPDALQKALNDAASTVAAVAMVRGVARLDFLVDGEEWFVNEINTIPGSLAKYLWEPAGVPFGQLLTDMLAEASARPSCRYDATGADGTALQSAGTIASKLA